MPARLSPKARKLLEMIQAGFWIDAHPTKAVEAMWGAAIEELRQAGLVRVAERVSVTRGAYVPADGYVPFVRESYAKRRAPNRTEGA